MGKLFLSLFGCLLLAGCGKQQQRLNEALAMAGNNRAEWETLLEHYRDSGQKYDAVRYLVENMPGNQIVDSAFLKRYAPIYAKYDSVRSLYRGNYDKFHDAIGAVKYLSRNDRAAIRPSFSQDLHRLKSSQLVGETDLAFKAWQENAYTRNASFADFCEYILPYRREQGLLIDSIRFRLYRRHRGFFANNRKDIREEVDSLLYLYKDIKYEYEMGIPVYEPARVETFGYCMCHHRCWFNSLLLSSLGMAVGIDYVPCWGNWNGSHTWNVLIHEGQSYAFEPFWDDDRWKYKRIYNNVSVDSVWGASRLPRVFRKTYTNYVEDIAKDPEMTIADIPALFRNCKKKDVSDEYFETTDVTIDLGKRASDAKYCFLCVWNAPEWNPVQWGKIKGTKATFGKMGRGIVYLPAFYSGGVLIPAANPFLLNADGSIRPFSAEKGQTEKVTVRRINGKVFYQNTNWKYIRSLNGILVCGIGDNRQEECLERVTIQTSQEHQVFKLKHARGYRYIRLHLPSELLAMGSLAFYTANGKVPKYKVSFPEGTDSTQEEGKPNYLSDREDATTYLNRIKSKYIDIDLGKEYRLTGIGVTPYSASDLKQGQTFTLKYWDKGNWQVVDTKEGNDSHLVFDQVPRGSLLMLKKNYYDQYSPRCDERIFIYDRGKIKWY